MNTKQNDVYAYDVYAYDVYAYDVYVYQSAVFGHYVTKLNKSVYTSCRKKTFSQLNETIHYLKKLCTKFNKIKHDPVV